MTGIRSSQVGMLRLQLATSFLLLLVGACSTVRTQCSPCTVRPPPPVAAALAVEPSGRPALPPAFNDIEKRTFQFFWDTTDETKGLTPDRYPARPFASIAAMGFALTAYPIGIENGWVSRTQAVDRTLTTLRFLRSAPQGPQATGKAGYHGFYYHFLDMQSGNRFQPWVELSSVDTTLLMMGVLFTGSYYDGNDPKEREIRALADGLYRAVDWNWMVRRKPLVSMGWSPESGFIDHDWKGYNEAMMVYVLALGSPTHPITPDAWQAWTSSYDETWGTFEGQQYLGFGPQFGHQYSQIWIDFRGIRDAWMRAHDLDYFENSRRATLAQRQYAIDNPMGWAGYGATVWGLTASDGPVQTKQLYRGSLREFRNYSARGVDLRRGFDDGTLAPTAVVGSLPFAPEIVVPATLALQARYGDFLYSSYGFLGAFNPSFTYGVPLKTGRLIPGNGWVASDYLGIDQGPIVTMIANYRQDFVWKVMRRNAYLHAGLERAGFSGGWLDDRQADGAVKVHATPPEQPARQ